jgi:hypothetical protein
MIDAVTSATQTDAVSAIESATSNQQPLQTKPQSQSNGSTTSNAIQDTVSISSAAQSSVQEATETQTQTAKEARGGDHQAQRLLAREADAKKAQQDSTQK